MLFEPRIELIPASVGLDAQTMFGSSAVDMINGQEFNSGLVAAYALSPAICAECSHLTGILASLRSSLDLFLVIVAPTFPALKAFCSVFVRHKKAASLQRAALTRHAGERQLVVNYSIGRLT